DNATNAFTTFINGDGIVTWTPPQKVDAGTILTIRLGGTITANNNLTNVTTGQNITSQAIFTGYATASNPILLNGEQVFIYRGAENNPFFIFGLNASRNVNLDANFWQTVITAVGPESMLPNGTGSQNALQNGVNAVGLLTNPANTTNTATQQYDNVFYSGPTTPANKATWLARITNRANWNGDDTGTGITSLGNTLGTSAVALPVNFGTIDATITSDQYTVSWQTLSETQNSHFEIQASVNGKDFTTIKTVASKAPEGNSSATLLYSVDFTREQAGALLGLGILGLAIASAGFKKRAQIMLLLALSGITLYSCSKNEPVDLKDSKVYIRIAQVDKDGNRTFSKVVVTNRKN
ncbi:MAG TPA: hypothetical protein VL943_12330, partial [Niabella sp.]|nr:hypothetical protein [Niabella sp.]